MAAAAAPARTAWTVEEDEALCQAVAVYGLKRWSQISSMLPGRTSKACSHRWRTYLQPGVAHTSAIPFTEWEVAVVKEAHKVVGNNWSVIARMLPGRTNAAIKNLWYRRQAAKGHRQRGAAAATGAAPLPAAAAEARRQLLPGGVAGNGGEEASDSEEMLGEEEGLDASDDMDVNDAGAADGAAEAGEEDEDEEDEEADAGEEVADYFGHAQAAAAAAAAAGGRGWGAAAGMPQWQVQQQQQFAGAATCSTGTAAGGWGFGAAPAAVDRMQHQRLSSRAPRRSSNHSWSGAAPFTAPALDGSCYAHPMLAPARGTVLPMPGGPAANQPASLAQTTTVHRGVLGLDLSAGHDDAAELQPFSQQPHPLAAATAGDTLLPWPQLMQLGRRSLCSDAGTAPAGVVIKQEPEELLMQGGQAGQPPRARPVLDLSDAGLLAATTTAVARRD